MSNSSDFVDKTESQAFFKKLRSKLENKVKKKNHFIIKMNKYII